MGLIHVLAAADVPLRDQETKTGMIWHDSARRSGQRLFRYVLWVTFWAALSKAVSSLEVKQLLNIDKPCGG